MNDPSRSAIHVFGGFAAFRSQQIDQLEKRDLTLCEIADLGRPVILLCINVEMKIVRPFHAAGQAIVPDALQRERERGIGTRAGDGEVSSVLKKQGQQLRIGGAIFESFAPDVGGLLPGYGWGFAQVDGCAPVESLVICDMGSPYLCE